MDGNSFTYIAVYNGNEKKGCWLRLYRLVKALARSGNAVHLVVPRCFEVQMIRGIHIWKTMPFDSTSITGLRKILNSVVGAMWASYLARTAKTKPIGIAFDSHNALYFALSKDLIAKLLFIRGETKYQAMLNEPPAYSKWMRLLDVYLKRRSDAIVVNNEKALSIYKLAGHTTTLLKNDTQVPLRTRVSQPASFTVGYCGQINERKNLSLLIRAFKGIKRPEFHMLIQGAGEGYGEILQASHEDPRITLKGWRRTTDEFYDAIDLFVLPSLFDDFSNAALDAIAHGIPVLISINGGSSEMACHNPEFVFDPDDGPEALKKKILYIKDNYCCLCKKISSISKNFSFDWEDEAEQTIRRLSSGIIQQQVHCSKYDYS